MIDLFLKKYKKQIIICSLFTFLFIPFNPSLKPKAEILALTTGGILACAGLAVACGVVITNPDMITDVGERIYEGIKNIPNAISNVGNNFKINVTSDLLTTTLDILKLLPIEDFIKTSVEPIDYVPGRLINFKIGTIPCTYNLTTYLNSYNNYMYINDTYFSVGSPSTSPSTITIKGVVLDGGVVGANVYLDGVYQSWSSFNTTDLVINNINGTYFTLESLEEVNSVCIPYTPSNSQNVSSDKPLEYFPTGTGSISVPLDRPITYNPSVDNPIVFPGDILEDGDTVSDTDTSVDTGTDTDTSVDTGSKLLDTLIEFLKTLFAPLTMLLEKILDLIQTIVNFFNPAFEMPAFPNIYPNYDITSLFDFSRLWNVQPTKPRWVINGFWSGLKHNMSSDDVVINLFDIPEIEENIDIIRNFTTYPLLIGVMWFIIKHFAPRRTYE